MENPTRLRDLKTGVRDMIKLDPSIIVIEGGHNPRDYSLKENREHIDALKGSIKENGVLCPMLVRWDGLNKKAVLVDGECRLRACLELIAEGVPIVSVPTIQVDGDNEADRLVTALTANTGRPLSKWESGSAFKRLVGFGWEVEAIGTKLGYTARYVREALELTNAPAEVKAMLGEKEVTPALALQHIRESGEGAVETLKAKVEEAKAKAREKATDEKSGEKAAAKVTAKRERKETKELKLSAEAVATVRAALEEAAVQKDAKCAELAEAALAIIGKA